ncbi:MAG: class I SAM-dependent methyltransferase, partial [Alphaproteobacteria bacterium]
MSDDALREAIGRYIWFHSMELRPGIASSGPKSQEILAREAAAFLGPLDLSGRNVLDIGAWNGFFSFESLRRGAALVLATDSVTWKHPEYRGRETLELAAAELGLPVNTLELDALELDRVNFKVTFDVVLFLGVFYHLIDPIRVVMALRRHTRQVLVLETVHDALAIERPSMIFYPNCGWDQDPTNWWGPNPAAVYWLLRRSGFGRVFYQDHPMHVAAGPLPLRRRGVYHAFVDDSALAALASEPQAWVELDAPGALRSLSL